VRQVPMKNTSISWMKFRGLKIYIVLCVGCEKVCVVCSGVPCVTQQNDPTVKTRKKSRRENMNMYERNEV
jgi:hypothetical protein